MSVLGRSEILKEMAEGRLCITPILRADQIRGTSVDVHLSSRIIVFKQTAIGTIDPLESPRDRWSEEIKLGFGRPFYLHPRQFVLASTLEFIKLPKYLCGSVIGRSTYGRLGLIIATAIHINAGFRGTITLELSNVGEIPIALYPCMRIGQIILQRVEGESTAESRYLAQMGPVTPRMDADADIAAFGKPSRRP